MSNLTPGPTSSLRDLQLAPEYRSSHESIVDAFYVPCLSRSVRYLRAAGYFTSWSLALAAAGLPEFLRGGGTMRMVVSPYLDLEDSQAMADRGNATSGRPGSAPTSHRQPRSPIFHIPRRSRSSALVSRRRTFLMAALRASAERWSARTRASVIGLLIMAQIEHSFRPSQAYLFSPPTLTSGSTISGRYPRETPSPLGAWGKRHSELWMRCGAHRRRPSPAAQDYN
jgi:hypothetical protein